MYIYIHDASIRLFGHEEKNGIEVWKLNENKVIGEKLEWKSRVNV